MESSGLLAASVPAEAPRRTKVAILGFTQSFQKAPFGDPSWEIWGLNELYMFVPRWDRWFELHSRAVYEADKTRVSDHVQKLMGMTCPVYMHQRWDDIPGSVPYPLDAIIQRFGNYFTNTISYMLALAIMEGFTEIGVYGVDMCHDCIGPDMRVLTADLRWVRAEDLHVGQELLAFEENIPVQKGGADGAPAQFRKYRKTRIESMSELTRPCHQLDMEDGSVLIASVGHQWLSVGGETHTRQWTKTDKLQAQETYPERASRIVKVMETWDEDRSWDAGYLAAAFDGEGHLSQTKRTNCSSTGMVLGFAQRENGMNTEFRAALGRLGVKHSSGFHKDGCHKYNIKGGRSEIMRVLGTVRPRRLLENFDADQVGTLNSIDNTAVAKTTYIGEQRVIGLTTTTGTLIVEGFASHNSEYSSQRPSCEWLVGWALGAGIKVTIPYESDLMKATYLYGYQEEEERAFQAKLKGRRGELEQKANQLDQQIAQLVEARAQYRGAIQDCDHVAKIWAPSANLTMGKPPGG